MAMILLRCSIGWIHVTLEMAIFLSDRTGWVFIQNHVNIFIPFFLCSSYDLICKRSYRVSFFNDWRFLEKMRHKREKILSDSALDNGATRHNSRRCNKLRIPKSLPIRKIIGQHFSADDFETYLLIWS